MWSLTWKERWILQLGATSPFRRVSEAPLAGFDTTLFLWVQKVTLETAVSGLEGLEGPVDPSAGCCFPVSQGFRCSACYKLETALFLWVQKVALETAVSGLEGPVDPSAGCCFPVSQGFRSSACWA